MGSLKVFVSSTCYDLNIVRSQIRGFIQSLGHEPIMSDYMEVLYDPRAHTHKNCLQEIAGADAAVLIIGSRYGGRSIPAAFNEIDFTALEEKSVSVAALEDKDNLSITQLEVCKAIEESIPVFAFVDERVMSDHRVYEANKGSLTLDGIRFPSIEKPETSKYIFEFINFLRHRTENNSITSFSKTDDIQTFLRNQWSSLFQRLLQEQRDKEAERKRIDYFANQIADLKAAVMSSIATPDLRQTASGAIRFRRLIDFVRSIDIPDLYQTLIDGCSWNELLEKAEIVEIREGSRAQSTAFFRSGAILIRSDGTFYETRFPFAVFQKLAIDWAAFNEINSSVKEAIIDAVTESSNHTMMRVRRSKKQFADVYGIDETVTESGNESGEDDEDDGEEFA